MEDQTTTEQAPVQAGENMPESLDQALGTPNQLVDEIQETLGGQPSAESEPVAPMRLDELATTAGAGATMRDLDLLADVEVEVAVEFGRTRMPLRQLLMLQRGSLVELARRPEQQVTVLANGTPIARGDIVIVDDQVGVHIVELVDPAREEVVAATAPAQVATPAIPDETDVENGEGDASGDADSKDPAAEATE